MTKEIFLLRVSLLEIENYDYQGGYAGVTRVKQTLVNSNITHLSKFEFSTPRGKIWG
jgi:hypothetical protein